MSEASCDAVAAVWRSLGPSIISAVEKSGEIRCMSPFVNIFASKASPEFFLPEKHTTKSCTVAHKWVIKGFR
jgi:hypothetical protein